MPSNPESDSANFGATNLNNSPTMVLYNVTVSVSQEHANDWVKFMMEEHIPEVLATGHFRDFRLCHVQGEAEGGVTFAVQYMARDAQSLETYQKEHAPAIQASHQTKWGSHAVAFRTVLPLIAEGHPTRKMDPKNEG